MPSVQEGTLGVAKPNFLVIHTDQHRADCLGIEGKRRVFTPNLDYLAVRGARFSAAYSTCPVCIPQRLTFLTGQLASTHGVQGNIGIPYFPMEHSLPKELRGGGYQTALVGRTFHTVPSDDPNGFEYYVPGDPSSELKDTKDHFFAFLRNNAPALAGGYYGNGTGNNSLVAAPFHMPNEFHHTQWTTEEALRFLNVRDTGRPFFLSVGYYAPHGPLNPPAEFFNRYYNNGDVDEPAIGEWDIPPVANWNPDRTGYVNLDGELLKSVQAGYYGNITFADYQIGRILAKVARMPNTYIIFTSDHGENLGDHYLYHKSRPYEGSAHIPFLIAGPGISPLQVRDEPVGWHDILPTVLDLAGLPCPEGVDGESIVSLLETGDELDRENGDELEREKPNWREYLHSENSLRGAHAGMYPALPGQQVEGNLMYEPSWHSLTDGKWKYIWFDSSGAEQLFNLVEDPDEIIDLSTREDYSENLISWRRLLAKTLQGRPEGFTSNGEDLVAGRPHEQLSEDAEQLMQTRISQGFDIAYKHYNKPRRP
ncbi:sulfatase-like hydrolase/transferase [Paenarthrobacter ureafaciens]|uniref:sulfatase-like hydrolase/transferase n=1 Tax=Paenarthrobacter ureafaciens TaxID=37931 RepID=UPI00346463DA